jgi:hypothetical protein
MKKKKMMMMMMIIIIIITITPIKRNEDELFLIRTKRAEEEGEMKCHKIGYMKLR